MEDHQLNHPAVLLNRDFMPYAAPFAVFAALTYLSTLSQSGAAVVYPLKTVITGLLLVYFWKHVKSEITFSMDWSAVAGGILVFGLWVGLEGTYPLIGRSEGFNPFELGSGFHSYMLIFFRLAGACIVVPVMEDLFWRSFALRFLIDSRFTRVRPGTFSWFSFVLVSVAFGFEHYRWLPGIMAGAVYALLYYRTRNLFSPIIAHAVTNLLLGIYVLRTGYWSFW